MLATFRVEAREHLEAMAGAVLELEQSGPEVRSEIVERIFRQAHSLKGAARSVAAGQIASFCQALENVFAGLKSGQVAVSPELFDILYRAMDLLRELVPADPNAPEPHWFQTCLAELNQWTSAPAPGRVEPTATTEPHAEQKRQVLTRERGSKGAAAGTVRVATAKLDAVLFQAEELLLARLTAAQRLVEWQAVTQDFASWHREWRKVHARLRPLERVLADPGAKLELGPVARPLQQLLAFANWNSEFMRRASAQVARSSQEAEREQRGLSAMLERLLDTTREAVMLPFSSLFELLPRLVRGLSREQGKEVELRLEGGHIEIDRRVLEELKDPLIHLVRNSIDHGLETPEERQAKGKPPRGTVTAAVAQRAGGDIELSVGDDGAGIDIGRLRKRAQELGLHSAQELQAIPDAEALRLVFESGFSTAPLITEISGRGLGLAIVREKVERLSGTVTVESRPGAGTIFRLRVPSTLARFRGVLVSAAGRSFVFPSASVQRLLRVEAGDLQPIDQRETLRLDGVMVPLAWLEQLLQLTARPEASLEAGRKYPVLVVGPSTKPVGLVVEEVQTELEVVMKRLSKPLVRVRNLSGATVLGDGRVVPVLNVNDLVRLASRGAVAQRQAVPRTPRPSAKSVLVAEDSITSRTLLKNLLQGAGFMVETAVDGADAWSALQSGRFDLLVSDVDMPRLSGFDLTTRVRQDPRLAQLPIVLVTALDTRQNQERGMEAGASAYVVKSSFDQGNLLEIVKQLVH